MFDTLGQSDQTNGYMPWGKTQAGPMQGQQFSPQYQNMGKLQMQSPAQWQLDFNKGLNSSFNPQLPFGQGGSPTFGVGNGSTKLPNQNTPWTWGGPGGKAATSLYGLETFGGLYMADEARKLGAADLDFRQQSFNDQYASQRSLVNDQLYDRQRRRNLESGMGTEAAGTAADEYVKNRGVA